MDNSLPQTTGNRDKADPSLVKRELHVVDADNEKTTWTTIGLSSMENNNLQRIPIMPQRSVLDLGAQASNTVDYKLDRVLGEGGMGVVYEAKQINLGRSVALKRLRIKEADSKFHGPFLAEAAITGQLDHPNIVPIHDVGIDEAGVPFYTMKQVSGLPWNETIQKLSRQENLDILMRIADAVAYSHDKKIIHRDIKPENVLLGSYGEVLLTDWGLALSLSELSDMKVDHAVGTPGYMPPEMAWGDQKSISVRSDIYLLGACLYHILVGEPPHPGRTVRDAIYSAAHNIIDPPIPANELGKIAERAMASDPKDRYQTVQEFQEAIRDYRIHESSMQLFEQGRTYFDQARLTNDHTKYARSLFALDEAIKLWPENQPAISLRFEVNFEYATYARSVGDLDLASGLLDGTHVEHQLLLEKIELDRTARKRSRRRVRILSFLSMGMGVLVCVILVASLLVVNRQFKSVVIATAQRQDAEARLLDEESKRVENTRWSTVFSDDLNDLSRLRLAGTQIIDWEIKEGSIVASNVGARMLLPATKNKNLRVQFDLLSGGSIRFLIGHPEMKILQNGEKEEQRDIIIDIANTILLNVKGEKKSEVSFPSHLVGFSHRIRVVREEQLITVYVNGQQVLNEKIGAQILSTGMAVELEAIGDYTAIDHIRIDHLK